MNGLIKKVSVLVLSVLVLVGGSLGGVSSAYAKSFKYQPPDPYVMDRGYQKLLEYYVLGYKKDPRDARKIAEENANIFFPRKSISNNNYLSKLSFSDSFKNGYEFIEFLIKHGRYLESGIYIFNIKHYYNSGSYHYVLHIKDPFKRLSSISSNSPKKPLPDSYLMDESNQCLYRYKVLNYKEEFEDGLKSVEDYARREFPKRSFEKKEHYPQKYFFKNAEHKEYQYQYAFKNGYEFIQFLNEYYKDFEKGVYLLEIGHYYNGGSYYYIIQFE